jgi:hypothetical protein
MTNPLLAGRRAAVVAALATASLAACGRHGMPGATDAAAGTPAPGNRVALSLSTWRPPSGQRCVAAPLPAALPSPTQLVDAGAVNAVLSPAPLPDGSYALLSVKFDTAGEVTRAVVIESSLADADRNRVALAVANALRPQPHAAAPWGVRLRLDATTPALFRVGRSEWCDASRASGQAAVGGSEMIGRATGGVATTVDQPVQEPARWSVVISPEGNVVAATLLTATHYPDRVHDTQLALARLRYHPALDDRVPVAVSDTIDFPITGFARH